MLDHEKWNPAFDERVELKFKSPSEPQRAGPLLISLWVLAGVLALFVISMTIDALQSDQSFASSAGLSYRECEQVARTYGATPEYAHNMCHRRIPK